MGISRDFIGVVFKATVMRRPILATKEKRGLFDENKKGPNDKSNRVLDMYLDKL